MSHLEGKRISYFAAYRFIHIHSGSTLSPETLFNSTRLVDTIHMNGYHKITNETDKILIIFSHLPGTHSHVSPGAIAITATAKSADFTCPWAPPAFPSRAVFGIILKILIKAK